MVKLNLLLACLLLCGCTGSPPLVSIPESPFVTPPPTSLAGPSDLSEWPEYRHEPLGVTVRYPPGWRPHDRTQAFIRFDDPDDNQGDEAFNIVNAPFPAKTIADFAQYIDVPVAMTSTITVDGQPALYLELEVEPTAPGYQSVVAILTPYHRAVTVANQTVPPELFKQILSTMRFFEPINPP